MGRVGDNGISHGAVACCAQCDRSSRIKGCAHSLTARYRRCGQHRDAYRSRAAHRAIAGREGEAVRTIEAGVRCISETRSRSTQRAVRGIGCYQIGQSAAARGVQSDCRSRIVSSGYRLAAGYRRSRQYRNAHRCSVADDSIAGREGEAVRSGIAGSRRIGQVRRRSIQRSIGRIREHRIGKRAAARCAESDRGGGIVGNRNRLTVGHRRIGRRRECETAKTQSRIAAGARVVRGIRVCSRGNIRGRNGDVGQAAATGNRPSANNVAPFQNLDCTGWHAVLVVGQGASYHW